jgi:hypothetical protein
MMRTRMALVLCAALALTALAVAGTGSAATPVNVSYPNCIFAHGGNATVPAGSDVTVSFGWGMSTRGGTQNFINGQSTVATVNGNPSDVSSAWARPVRVADIYLSFLNFSAGTLANGGDSVVVGLQITLAHGIPVGKDPTTGKQLFSGPGDVLPNVTCTITAV